MCAKSEQQVGLNQNTEPQTLGSLRNCLIDGDISQRITERKRRRRSLIISIILQIAALTAIVLVPLLSRTERIAFANVTPPPYRHAAATPTTEHHHTAPPTHHGFSFCLTCAPVITHLHSTTSNLTSDKDSIIDVGGPETIDCPECAGLTGKTPPPVVPHDTAPHIVHVTSIEPAMLIHRVEPIFPALARQTGRVELRAIIATDGSVRSLQTISGDPLFYQSALDAVRQWRYKPTYLNGNPVEVDTRITVIYTLTHN